MKAVLADREPAVRRALHTILTQDLGVQVVGEAATAQLLRSVVLERQPDLLVVDWGLIESGAALTLAALRRSCPGLRVIVLGLRPETRRDALTAGADVFAAKVDAPGQVIDAVRAASSHSRGKHLELLQTRES